ncbi:putative GIY-YIG superfamily endonuclease [Rhizobium sp. BK049]|nr:putative GIY-YIG superfamily endonuclease [Rhizobium sp. BK049]
MKGHVYILASARNGTLYTGVTRDLAGRLFEHQNELTPGFTSKYGVKTPVWFEEHDLLTTAITREKTIKKMAAVEARSDRAGESRMGGHFVSSRGPGGDESPVARTTTAGFL